MVGLAPLNVQSGNVTNIGYLVGGLEHQFCFPRNVGFLIIPIDELIFFRGVAQPPTSYVHSRECENGYVDFVTLEITGKLASAS